MRTLIHSLIVWYLRRCDGAFHHYPYGPAGRYIVMMSETEYSNYERLRGGRFELRKK